MRIATTRSSYFLRREKSFVFSRSLFCFISFVGFLVLVSSLSFFTGRYERKGRVRAHADRRREVLVLPAAGLLLPRLSGRVFAPHLPRSGSGALR